MERGKSIIKKSIATVLCFSIVLSATVLGMPKAYADPLEPKLTFTGGNSTSPGMGTELNDNHSGNYNSTDIPDIQLDIYCYMTDAVADAADAPSADPTTGAQYFGYYSASDIAGLLYGVLPADGGFCTSEDAVGNQGGQQANVIVIKGHNGSKFKFKSIFAVQGMATSSCVVKGYKGGKAIDDCSQTFSLTDAGSTLSIDSTKTGFDAVDEVRICASNDGPNWAYFNDIALTTTASVVAPTTQSSAINFSSVTSTGMTIGMTSGNGSSRAVFVKEGAGAITNPTDGTTYTANPNWSSKGTQLGTSGYYCVYNGAGNSVSLTGLSADTAYAVQVFDYNGSAGSEKYITSTATNNPQSQTTINAISSIARAGTASTNASTVSWTVTFAAAETGLTASNFSLVKAGTGGSISSVTGSGTTWTVTADTVSGNGTLGLNLTNITNLSPDISNPLPFDGDTYTIDNTAPTANIVMADAALKIGKTSLVTFTFSKTVTGFTNADLTIANGTLGAVSSSDGGKTWTATFTPTSGIQDTANVITLDNTGVADLAGNAGAGTTDSNNYVVDTIRPTATIVVADTALIGGETSLVTFTFSEAVTGFTNSDLTISNGTLSAVSSSDGGKTWTATFTPAANTKVATNVISLDNTGVTDLVGNSGTGTTSSGNYAINTKCPTATIVVADTALRIGETSSVTITFSEAVTGFTNVDLTTIDNGTLSTVSTADGGVTWTAMFTPTADIEDTTNVITLNNAGVMNQDGNAGTGTTNSNSYAIDTTRPTAGIVVADPALKIGETSLVTITFSEAVTGFSNADLTTIANGTLNTVSSSDGGITWIATFTPTANIEDTTNVITLDNTGVADLAGNAGTGTTDSNNYAVDTTRPTATIAVADTDLNSGKTSLVTITFSEAVTGFTNADLTISNGTLTGVTSSDGGVTWTATFTPAADIEDTTNLITLNNTGVTDLVGNAGAGTTNSNNYTINTKCPTATIVVADTALRIGETSLVTITFSEAVTGFANADLTIANGTLTGVTSSDGGITWTATFTPAADIEDTTNLITLNNAGVANQAGNAGTGTTNSNNYAVDTIRPTAVIVVADTALKIGKTSLVTITFSEAVTGFSNAGLTVANGVLGAVNSSDGKTWTATFTPVTGIQDTANVITFDNTGVADLAGNAGVGTTDSNNYVVDTIRPTATIVVADTDLKAGETSLVTITFSEAVTGFTNTDLTIANGTLSAVSSSDVGKTWTATFTPTVNTKVATNVITLDNTGVADLAGNAGTGATSSGNYAVNTKCPTATIVVADSALKIGETSSVTITFSEAITGFTNSDLTTIDNGTLSTVSTSDGGITWTATFTPAADIEDTTNVITLNNEGVADLAGNAGTGTTNSNNYAVDTIRPTASIVVADTALKIGETSSVTITFSEAVTGFSNTGLTVANGTLSTISSSDGGKTWTATFTPTANIEDATNVITLVNTGVADLAGNAGTGTTDSNNYAIDTKTPTVTGVTASTGNGSYKVGDIIHIAVTFSEPVTVTAVPQLTLDTGRTAVYISGSTSGTLLFTYTVQTGDASPDLDYASTSALSGTIADAAGNAAALTLPTPGAADSLGANAAIVIDTAAPTVTNGTIAASDITSNSVKLAWTAADLGMSQANLQYKVVYSTSDITTADTLSNITTADTLSGTWTANITTATVTGLTASTDYYFNVLVKDAAGNKALYTTATGKTMAVASGGVATTTTSNAVEVNGQKQDAGSSSTSTSSSGQTTTTVTVDSAKLTTILNSTDTGATVTIPISGGSDVASGVLTGDMVKSMETKDATLEIKTGAVTYTLPASQINIDSVSSQLGSQVALKDIQVSVSIAEPSADTVKVVQDTANKNSYQLVVKPVEFEITCTSGGKTVDVSRFNGYVERTVTIPDGVDPSKITTGIVLNADGTFSHVPTQIVVINGKYYAKINSLTNSTYSVIYNPVEFSDLTNHWAKAAINEMGSRMVVNGDGNGSYNPDKDMTRAEFAAVVVRALGLTRGTGESGFGDVSSSDWFCGYAKTAVAYGIIKGYGDGTFGPNDTITREQAMAMLARAMKLTGLSTASTDTTALLAKFTDSTSASSYATDSIAACIATGVVTGISDSTISPKSNVTRAEVAVMVQRLLQKSGLINY